MTTATEALHSEAVQDAKQAVKDEKRRRKDIADRLDSARHEVEDLKEELVEARADRSIGKASETDVDEARDDLQAAKMKVSDLRDEHEAAGRAIEKLGGRLKRVKDRALTGAKWELKEEYFKRLKAAQQAVEAAQEAVKHAAEVGTDLSHGEFQRVDLNDMLVPGALHGDRQLEITNGQGVTIGEAVPMLRKGVQTLETQLQDDSLRETYEDLE